MNNSTPTVAVDVMGSDMGPEELIIGVKKALAEDKSNYEIIIVGNESVITPMLLRHNLIRESRIKVYHASEVIEMDEKPIQAIKSKRDSSMMRAIELVKLGTADAVLSWGFNGRWNYKAAHDGRNRASGAWYGNSRENKEFCDDRRWGVSRSQA